MRATQAPEQWQQVLNAINHDDYKLANKLAVRYNFASAINKEKIIDDIRHTPLKGDYVAMDPDGNIYCHERASVLSGYLGMVHSYVVVAIPRLERHGGVAKKREDERVDILERVVVYTKNNCIQCIMTKQELTRHGLTYKEINVEEQPTALEELIERNLRSMPVVVVDDNWVEAFGGFQPDRLEGLVG